MPQIGSISLNNTVSTYNNTQNQTKSPNGSYETDSVYYFPSGGGGAGSGIAAGNTYIAIPFYKYVRPNVQESPTLPSIGTIVLPIPNELKDSQSLSYGQNETSPIVEALIGAYMAKQFNNLGTYEQLGVNELIDLIKKGLNAAGSGFLGTKNLGATVAQVGGYTENPYLTMLFKNPVFKRFVFSWLFIPQSKKESDDLNYIINKLRYHALPGISSLGSILYNYPDMCRPILIPSGYQFDFKHCVIENITIDYVPGNTPAFQAASKAPVAIRLAISLLEIELWTKGDLLNTNVLNYRTNANGLKIGEFGSSQGYLN